MGRKTAAGLCLPKPAGKVNKKDETEKRTGFQRSHRAERFVIHDPQEQKGKWAEAFGRKAPLHIEIGTGKGRFLMELAALHPEIDYIGIEKYSSVLLRAIQKMEERELPNVRFIRMDAEEITEVFGPRRSGPHLPEFFRSLAQGPARQEKASLQTVPEPVRADPEARRDDRVQDGQPGPV